MKCWHEPLESIQRDRKVSLRLTAFVLVSFIMHGALLWQEQHHAIDLGNENRLVIRLIERQQQQPGEKAHTERTATRPKSAFGPAPVSQPTNATPAPVQTAAVMDESDTLPSTKAGGVADAATESPAIERTALRASIKGRLQRQFAHHFNYPLLARRRGWQGEVLLAFRLEADGRITDARVDRSSGYSLLDRAALTSLGKIERIEMGASTGFTLQLPVIYRLQEG